MPPQPPTARLSAPSSVRVGVAFTVDASGSTDGPGGGGIRKYDFDFGDGTRESSSNPIASHTYQDVDTYPITVTVTNKKGRSNATAPVMVAVQPADAPPVPVDCVLGLKVSGTPGSWGTCQPNNTQQRTVPWTKSILTPASNGGLSCGPTSGSDVETQACVYTPPAGPVNCVLGVAVDVPVPWGPCQPGGTQTRTVSWTKAIVTPASNGGTPCGPTSGSRVETRPCVSVPPGTGPHATFNALVELPETVFAYPLRSDGGIAPYVRAISGASGTWAYDASEDAARCTLFANFESAPQLYLPISLPPAGQLVIIYDFKPSANWIAENGLGIHKMENVLRTGNKIWFELNNRYPTIARGGVIPAGGTILSRHRQYSTTGLEAPHFIGDATGYTKTDAFGTVSYDGDAVKPILSNYVAPREKWVRKMVVLDQSALNGYVQVSTWMCDETHDPVQVLDQCGVGLSNAERPVVFDLEVNTSAARTGPEVYCWFRNVWVGRGVASPISLLARPT